MTLPPQRRAGNGLGAIFGDILRTRGLLWNALLPFTGRDGLSRGILHTTDPKTEADICGGLHFLTAHELKGKPTSVSSSTTLYYSFLASEPTDFFMSRPVV